MRKRTAARLTFLAVLALCITSGGRASVLCVHTDGTAALESGAERCCRGVRRDLAPSPAAGLVEQAAGDCRGCEDWLLALEPGNQTPRTSPLVSSAAPLPPASACAGGGARRRLEHRPGGASVRIASRPLFLRI